MWTLEVKVNSYGERPLVINLNQKIKRPRDTDVRFINVSGHDGLAGSSGEKGISKALQALPGAGGGIHRGGSEMGRD
jgi:hypothetical protein